MVRCVCVVNGCERIGKHVLPKDVNRRSLWIKAMKLEEHVLKRKYPAICPLHFKETDYVDFEFDGQFKHRITLKRHAVPSIFSWDEPPPSKAYMFISPEEHNKLSDSESANEKSETGDPLVGFTGSKNTVKEEPENHCVSSNVEKSDEEDCNTVLPFNASKIIKKYLKQKKPVKSKLAIPHFVKGTTKKDFIQDLCKQETDERKDSFGGEKPVKSKLAIPHFVKGTTKKDFIQDLCKQETDERKDSFGGGNNYVEFELDIPNSNGNEEDNVLEQIHDFTVNIPNTTASASICVTCGRIPSYSVHCFKNESNALQFYTGFETFDKLMSVFKSLGSTIYCLKYIHGKPPSHLDPLEQFCMTLFILRRHREFEDIAFTYKTSIEQVTNIFITWIPFMALQWRTSDLRLCIDAVSYYVPLDFNDKQLNTRVIVDATDIPIKKPKMLVGLTHSGLITYISPCYGGFASNTKIIERSSILNCFNYKEKTVDEGINVQNTVISNEIEKVNMPNIFKKGNQRKPNITQLQEIEKFIAMKECMLKE